MQNAMPKGLPGLGAGPVPRGLPGLGGGLPGLGGSLGKAAPALSGGRTPKKKKKR